MYGKWLDCIIGSYESLQTLPCGGNIVGWHFKSQYVSTLWLQQVMSVLDANSKESIVLRLLRLQTILKHGIKSLPAVLVAVDSHFRFQFTWDFTFIGYNALHAYAKISSISDLMFSEGIPVNNSKRSLLCILRSFYVYLGHLKRLQAHLGGTIDGMLYISRMTTSFNIITDLEVFFQVAFSILCTYILSWLLLRSFIDVLVIFRTYHPDFVVIDGGFPASLVEESIFDNINRFGGHHRLFCVDSTTSFQTHESLSHCPRWLNSWSSLESLGRQLHTMSILCHFRRLQTQSLLSCIAFDSLALLWHRLSILTSVADASLVMVDLP